MIDINELRRLVQAATPGPWHATKSVETNSWAVWSDTTRLMELRPTKTVDMYRVSNTAAFIAAANPAAVSELLDRLEAAEKERDHEKWLRERAEDYSKAVADQREALRAKIVEMEKQEPVAWMDWNGTLYNTVSHVRASDKPLYLAPGAQGEEK